MAWLDTLRGLPWQAWASTLQSMRDIRLQVDRKVGEAQQWHAEQTAERTRLLAERQAAQAQVNDLEDFSRFPGMTPEQRSAQIRQLRSQMPGWIGAQHQHPWAQLATAAVRKPLSIMWHAIRGAGGAIGPAHITPGSNTMLLALAIVYHFSKLFLITPTLQSLLWINFFMILLVIFLIFDSSERNGDTYRTLFLWVFCLEILIPYITNEFAILQQIDFIRLYVSNGFIILTWIYYAVFIRGQGITTGPTRWWRIAIILFWLGVLFSFIGTSMVDFSDIELDTAGADRMYAAGLMWDRAFDGWKTLWNGVLGGFGNMRDIFSMRMKQATGEYYYGVVEENENEKLGVYLEDLTASKTEYEENEQVTVYASLLARTLDDAVTITVACYAGSEKNRMNGSVYPDTSFEIYNLQQEELDCSFPKLSKGTNKVTYTADFNFQTIGYLKRYFTDRDALTAATRQGIDLLDEYQIQDQAPVAHYTNGPVAIGMGPEEPLLGISESYAVKPRLALTLDSGKGWAGMIRSLDEVVLIIPEEMSLDIAQCTDDDWTPYTVDDCISSEETYNSKVAQECGGDESCIEAICTAQLDGYNAYTLAVDKPEYKNIKDFITISCRLNIDEVSGLLGATPISTHYFYVKTRYDYQLSDDTSVTVIEREESQPSGLAGDTRKSTGSTPTFSSSEKDELLQYIFYNYGSTTDSPLFSAQKEHGVYACDLAALIAQTSSGNQNYYLDGRTGLMGVTPSIAAAVASQAGLGEKYDLYNPATNIDAGAAYVQNIIEATGRFPKEIAKVYYAGIYMLSSDDATASSSQIELYAALVDSYATLCRELGLQNSPLEDEKNKDDAILQGSVLYSSVTETTPLDLFIVQSSTSGKFLNLTFTHTQGAPLSAHMYYNQKEIDSVGITSRINLWYGFDHYPTLQVQFNSTAASIFYRFFQDFVVNTEPLLEDEEYPLLSDMLFVEYDGTNIIFRLANNIEDPKDHDEICSIRWFPYNAYATCAEDGLPGLIVRNLETKELTAGQGYAKVQIEWNTQEQFAVLED